MFKRVVQETRRGFSKWVQPRMSKYLMACCDCGLVHEMKFRVRKTTRGSEHVQFKARRADGHTKRLRAKDAKRKKQVPSCR